MKREKEPWVYILTNKSNSVLYTGVTSDLEQRIAQHKTHALGGFTAKYNVTKLVYCEQGDRMDDAIAREKEIKGWRRARKVKLIESVNPDWRDLSEDRDSSVAPLPQNDENVRHPERPPRHSERSEESRT